MIIYNSYISLAKLFQEEGNIDKSISYYMLGLDVLRLAGSETNEIEATRYLGEALLEKGNIEGALDYFQQSHNIAKTFNSLQGETLAKNSLVHVHTALANKLESEMDFKSAIPHHLKCLEYFEEDRGLNEVYYRLGKAYQEIGILYIYKR